MSEQRVLIGPRHAAQVLGVHENTIRNWVKERRLTDYRVKGSRFIRLDLAEITGMRATTPVSASAEQGRHTHTTQTRIPGYDVFITITIIPTTEEQT